MPSGIAIDANVMALFTESLIHEMETPARSLVEKIETSHGFAIDEAGRIRNQWFETCNNIYFSNWFVDGLKTGRIRTVVAKLEQQHKKYLRIKCGMPADRAEHAYVAVANVVEGRKYIVTDDIDFWEPKHKKSDERTKTRFKEERTGSVCTYLRRIGITVGTVAQGLADL